MFALVAGCAPEVSPPANSHAIIVQVESEAGAILGQSSRFRIFGSRAGLPESMWVVRGKVTSYAEAQIRMGDPSDSLLARRVPSYSWLSADGGELVVVPLEILAETTALVDAPRGKLFEAAAETEALLFRRIWPQGQRAARLRAVYCLPLETELKELQGLEVTLEPGHERLAVELGVGGSDTARCVTLTRLERVDLPASTGGDDEEALSVGPSALGPYALEPTLFRAYKRPVEREFQLDSPVAPPTVPACPTGALPVLRGCAKVFDNRVSLAFSEPLLVAIEAMGISRYWSARALEVLTLNGLKPETRYRMRLWMMDVDGQLEESELDLQTGVGEARVVLSEVMANPLGPEPQQEWVELANHGTKEQDLGELLLEDSDGTIKLPALVLQPQEYALLVNENYEPGHDTDVAPPAGVRLLRVPRLGSRGLSNAGEPFRLLSAEGSVLSVMPAHPKPLPGVSLCRGESEAGVETIGYHGAPGASPGLPNLLAPSVEEPVDR